MPFIDPTTPGKEEILSRLHPTPCNVVRTLVKAGYEAYIVGGAIRDLLTGNTPKDYDICTSATPEQVRSVFGRRRCHVIGRRFRLAHVYSGGELYEVSTFRRVPDEKERKGRKDDEGPLIWNDNCYGTLEEDAQRRDFTCNALYFDVTGDRGIIDFSGGLRDIPLGIVRCIGAPSERLAEDPVRMLRALKLVGQFGMKLEASLEEAIRNQSEMIRLASPSRLFEELLKILNHPNAWQTLTVLHDNGFLKHFWPTVDESWDDQEGEMLRNMLKLRGDAIRRGHYSNSRGLALSTVSMPFLMSALNPEHPLDFWDRPIVGNELARKALRLVFEGFMLPHIFEERILVITGMAPRLRTLPVPPRLLNNTEYRYARAVVALLAQLFGWDQEFLAKLPEFSPRYDASCENPGGAEGDNAAGGIVIAAFEAAAASDDGNSDAQAADDGEERPARRRRPRRNRRRGRKPDAGTAAGDDTAEASAATDSADGEADGEAMPDNSCEITSVIQEDSAPASTATRPAPPATPAILPLVQKKRDATEADATEEPPAHDVHPETPRRSSRRAAASFEDGGSNTTRRNSRMNGDGESITFG